MAKKNFIDRYLSKSATGGRKKSKSISFDEDVLDALVHNAKVAKVSVSTLVQDAIKELGLDKKVHKQSEHQRV